MTLYVQKTLATVLFAVVMLLGAHVAWGQFFGGGFNSTGFGFTAPTPLTGYAYAGVQNNADGSAQGMGFISLNCSNDGSCGVSNYRVQINPDLTVTGYAWGGNTASANGAATGLGWVRFGGLSGCPSGSNCNARVTGTTATGYELTGWARACSVFADPTACSGALAPATVTGGWDGWISLNCDNHDVGSCTTYRVGVDTDGTFGTDPNGAGAWGSDVLGLVTFRYAGFAAPSCGPATAVCSGANSQVTGTDLWCNPTPTVITTCPFGCNAATGYCNGSEPTGSFTLSPSVVRQGDAAQIAWNMSAPCTVSGPGITPPAEALSGTLSTGPVTQRLSTYVLTCGGVEVRRLELRTLPSVFES